MELLTSKLVAMAILGIVSIAIGVAAVGLRRILGLTSTTPGRKQVLCTSVLLCFGAGVLLCTALLHMLPEVREGLEETQERLEVEWLGELVICAGFFLIYLVEEAVHLFLHGTQPTQHTEQLQRSLSIRRSTKAREQEADSCNNTGGPTTACNHSDMEVEAGEGASTSTTDSAPGTNYNPKYSVRLSLTTSDMFPNYQAPDSIAQQPHQEPNSSHSHLVPPSGTSSPVRDFLTVLALSFHAVFEGLAVGLEEHSEDVWKMFAAIATHKFVITFCVSLELLQAGTSSLMFSLYLVTFSLVSSLGVGVGIGIDELSTADTLTVAVLQGLASGTILYVVMFEVLQREKGRDVPGVLQLAGVLTGFLVMLMLQIFGHHEHEHGAEEGSSGVGPLGVLGAPLLASLGNLTTTVAA